MTQLQSEPFGQTPGGQPASVHTLANDRLRVRITDYGGRMVSIEAPDRHGSKDHILLGFADVGRFARNGGSFGALLGRSANRIAKAEFELDGKTYHLSRNDGEATLHGGALGFNKVLWTVTQTTTEPHPSLTLTHVSPDGDQGFPGEVTAEATYRLENDSLWLTFYARTTKPTIVNLSAHPYFNLGGPQAIDVLAHEVMIPAEAFLPTDAAQIPTGERRRVEATPFDFRRPTPLGARIRQPDEQLIIGTGYDHCFILPQSDQIASGQLALAARIRDPASGRVLEVHTDQPGVQIYSGNKLTGAFAGHGGILYRQSAGLAVEAQGLPDAPHHPDFPSTVLRPDQTYKKTICYRFYAT